MSATDSAADIKAGVLAVFEGESSFRRARIEGVDDGLSTVPAADVGAMLVQSRNAGREEAERAAAIERLEETQNRLANSQLESVVRGGQTPLAATQTLLQAGARDQAFQLLGALKQIPETAFEARGIEEALARHEANEQLGEQLKQIAANEAAARETEARHLEQRESIARTRPDIAPLADRLYQAALEEGETISPRDAAQRAAVLKVAEGNVTTKNNILAEAHKSSGGRPLLDGDGRKYVGAPTVGLADQAQRVVDNAKIVHPESAVALQKLAIVGADEKDHRQLHEARARAANRQIEEHGPFYEGSR